MSTPRSAAARIELGSAPEPVHPIVPADATSGASGPIRSANAARRSPSAIGDQHTLPVHTTKTLVMGPRVYTGPSEPPGGRRSRNASALARSDTAPARTRDGLPWARSTTVEAEPVSRSGAQR